MVVVHRVADEEHEQALSVKHLWGKVLWIYEASLVFFPPKDWIFNMLFQPGSPILKSCAFIFLNHPIGKNSL